MTSEQVTTEREPYPLSDGVPTPLTQMSELQAFVESLACGHGPIALDAERASGFRYSQRAYLIQIRREGSGTALIDPLAFDDLSPLADVLREDEWILHAATQDLPCLKEVGLQPSALFDTELAGRLLGHERVNLAALVDEHLGHYLPKGHGATDWSQRPFTTEQLRYAALDVELLVPLRNSLHSKLVDKNLLDAAQQEFAHLLSFQPRDRGTDAWRRISGLHKVRNPKNLAVVKTMWERRDQIAREKDLAPGRVLPDAAIIAAALARPQSIESLAALPEYARSSAKRNLPQWWQAIEEAADVDPSTLNSSEPRGLPAPRTWKEKNPPAALRLEGARAALEELSNTTGIPTENLMTPEIIRQVCWNYSESWDHNVAAFTEELRQRGARPWQCALVAPAVTAQWAKAVASADDIH